MLWHDLRHLPIVLSALANVSQIGGINGSTDFNFVMFVKGLLVLCLESRQKEDLEGQESIWRGDSGCQLKDLS